MVPRLTPPPICPSVDLWDSTPRLKKMPNIWLAGRMEVPADLPPPVSAHRHHLLAGRAVQPLSTPGETIMPFPELSDSEIQVPNS